VIVLERRTQGAAAWSCAAELLDAPALGSDRSTAQTGQWAVPIALPSDQPLGHKCPLGEERDEPLGKGRPPVQPAGPAHRLRTAAIFKWLGLLVAGPLTHDDTTGRAGH